MLLRSRVNRTQRPSEPTGEGSSHSPSNNGYPSSDEETLPEYNRNSFSVPNGVSQDVPPPPLSQMSPLRSIKSAVFRSSSSSIRSMSVGSIEDSLPLESPYRSYRKSFSVGGSEAPYKTFNGSKGPASRSYKAIILVFSLVVVVLMALVMSTVYYREHMLDLQAELLIRADEDVMLKRENVLWERIDALTDRIKSESKREVIKQFGPGPFQVEVDIEYPQYTENQEPSQWPRTRGTFVIELAPLDLMPHAINLFLQQVHEKLWTGCVFVVNALHILQAGPHKFLPGTAQHYEANTPQLVKRFEDANLNKLAFQEYNDDFPHAKYTVGFAGRPAGPDFYINKINNSGNHGPGGQSHYHLHEEADPCFGKLIGGMEHMVNINRIPVDRKKGSLLTQEVLIVDTRIVTPKIDNSNNRDNATV